MEANYPQQYNKRCRIISKDMQGMKCLQFWYHMYGMEVDTPNIYIQSNCQRGKPVWTRSRNQGQLIFLSRLKSIVDFSLTGDQ